MRTKRAFKVKWISFSIIFKGLLVAKNCPRPESGPLKATTNAFLKISFSLCSICKICQFLLMICLRSGRVLLKVAIKGIFSSFCIGFLFKISVLGIAITLLMWVSFFLARSCCRKFYSSARLDCMQYYSS